MTNEELKKKIVEVVRNSEITGIQIRDIMGGYSMANNIADALIEAGIGDVSCLREHRVIAEYSLVPDDENPYIIPNVPLRVTQLYSGEEVEKMAKERKELKDELRSKVEYIHEQDEVIKEYKHRAEVAERALFTACIHLIKDEEDNVNMELLAHVVYTNYLRKAEKELTEEERK